MFANPTSIATIETKDRARLAKVLAMLGSSSDAEALIAARAAERLRQRLGVSWNDVVSLAGRQPVDRWGTR
jgi:hypothetical protein